MCLTWILMLLFLAGVVCSRWTVRLEQPHICAVKGSSAVISCSFRHPGTARVKTIMWGHKESLRSISHSNSSEATSRFKYIGDRHRNCSLKIQQVEHDDAGNYTISFFTDTNRGLISRKIQTLSIVDLNISASNANTTTKEGDSVHLSCINGCDSDKSSAFTWFKNGQLINEGPDLYLSNMSTTDSGNYTCSLKTQPETSSRVKQIDVEYGPKNTSASDRPSMELDHGSIFTLICSSHANPPAENYTWFKKENNDVVVGHRPVLSSGDGGHYFCSAANKHGSQNSSVVTVTIQSTFTRDALLVATAVLFLILTCGIFIRRRCKKKSWAQNAECEEEVQETDYVNWLGSDNVQSNDENQRDGGTEIIYAAVCFNNRKPSMQQQTVSCNEDKDVIYSTVCRYQMMNPLYIEPS